MESDSSDPKKTDRPGILSTIFSINTSRNYDRDVEPSRYERLAKSKGRARLGEYVTETLRTYLPPGNEGIKVLDIATGTGIIAEELHKAGYRVMAADLSEKGLQFGKEKRPFMEPVKLDMNTDLPFSDSSFDGVTTVASNRYIENPEEFLREVCRILKSGGVFVWPIFEGEALTSIRNLKMLKTFDLEKLREQALEAGFKEVKIVRQGVRGFEVMAKKKLMPEYIPNFIIAIK